MLKLNLTTASEEEWLCWVNGDTANVVTVSLELMDALQGVVVVHAHMHVILDGG